MKRYLALSIALLLAGCSRESVVLTEPVADVPDGISSSSVHRISSSAVEKAENIRLRMPFASQAPLGNWDMPYQEACEEASLLLVHHYLSKEPLSPEIMDDGILDLVQWEKENGFPIDIDVPQLAEVARGRFGYNTAIVEGMDITIERIESELSRGNPVIVPLAGQDIGNPYYSGEGPPYHMLVIVGYDKRNFLTHDVGTRRGEYYEYKKQVIMDAIHDWTGTKETIRSGSKRMLVVTQ